MDATRRSDAVSSYGLGMATDEEIGFPLGNTDERELFLNWLRYLRSAILRNVDGLDDEQARWRSDGHLLPLLGIVHHLTNVEMRWIDGGFLGGPVERADDEPLDVARLTLNGCVDAYQRREEATERAVRTLSLDTPHPYGPEVNLRWVLLHLVNETARHAGHADSVRELLDGTVGE
jgi:uncharacterized damage-inducible protein DinB